MILLRPLLKAYTVQRLIRKRYVPSVILKYDIKFKETSLSVPLNDNVALKVRQAIHEDPETVPASLLTDNIR